MGNQREKQKQDIIYPSTESDNRKNNDTQPLSYKKFRNRADPATPGWFKKQLARTSTIALGVLFVFSVALLSLQGFNGELSAQNLQGDRDDESLETKNNPIHSNSPLKFAGKNSNHFTTSADANLLQIQEIKTLKNELAEAKQKLYGIKANLFTKRNTGDKERLAAISVELGEKEHLVNELENKIEKLEAERAVNIEKIQSMGQVIKDYCEMESKRSAANQNTTISSDMQYQNLKDNFKTQQAELRKKINKLEEKQNILAKELEEKTSTIQKLETEALKKYTLRETEHQKLINSETADLNLIKKYLDLQGLLNVYADNHKKMQREKKQPNHLFLNPDARAEKILLAKEGEITAIKKVLRNYQNKMRKLEAHHNHEQNLYEQRVTNSTIAMAQRQLDLLGLLDVYAHNQNRFMQGHTKVSVLSSAPSNNSQQGLTEKKQEIATLKKTLRKYQEEIERLHEQLALTKTNPNTNLSNTEESLTQENSALHELIDTYANTQEQIIKEQEKLSADIQNSKKNFEQTSRENENTIFSLQGEIERLNRQVAQEKTQYEQNLFHFSFTHPVGEAIPTGLR